MKSKRLKRFLVKIKGFRLPLPLHPFLYATFLILFLYQNNMEQILPNVIIKPIIGSLVATLIFYLLVNLVLKNQVKSGIKTTLFVVLFFSYGHVKNVIGEFTLDLGVVTIGPDKTLLTFWVFIIILIGYFVITTAKNLKRVESFLTVGISALVVLSIFNLANYELKNQRLTFGSSNENVSKEVELIEKYNTDKAPDIYYIIFDRYSSKKTLKEFFNYDNSKFLDYLKKKGFYVASDSHANYPKTHLSLASSLNLKHITNLREEVGENTADQTKVNQMLQDYEVWRFLKARGYKFIHFGDWWSPTRYNEYADVNYNYFITKTDRFSFRLLETTLIAPIADILSKGDTFNRNEQRNRTLFKFDKLEEIPESEGPKFIFAHMLTPHPPYVLDENCGPLTDRETKLMALKDEYIEQLKCTNKKAKKLIDIILTESKNPPIILLQADEGPFLHKEYEGGFGGNIEWNNLSEEALSVHMGILNAYYLPESSRSILYNSITPVNSFRIVFNEYFGTDYELLEDKIYIFEDSKHPYKFIDVTDKLRNEK